MQNHPILGKQISPKINDQIFYLAELPILAKNVKIWERQRTLDPERVEEIVKDQKEYYKKNDKYRFRGHLTLVTLYDKIVMIDGQHRYQAMKVLARESAIFARIPVIVCLINTKTANEVFQEFQLINKSISVPETFINPNILIKAVCNRIREKFPVSFTNASINVITTKINQDQLESALIASDIVKELNITEEDQLYAIILDYNNKIRTTYCVNDYKKVCPKSTTKEKIKEYLLKVNNPAKRGMHLSMFKDFRWIDEMIQIIQES
jgi:hypothetical protein